ncbi:MAG: hypothetical protein A3H36_09050 [Chloroflexi bacterium RIFCSPLOWO2_02_FULL_71_16]|nr:MAG: hypothetical protein A3H36_09050 [Chloroflexi bacterium RIFCSPLOWO2_02_FULL_71_16]
MRKKCTILCTRRRGRANQYSISPMGRTIRTSRPVSSRTSRMAHSSMGSSPFGVPLGSTHMP